MQEEVILSIGDLGYVVLTCTVCSSRLSLDARYSLPVVPRSCPLCGGAYDDALKDALAWLRKGIEQLAHIDKGVVSLGIVRDRMSHAAKE